MSEAYSLKISPEQAKEMPMVDLAFEVLKSANTPYYYRDLMAEIAKIKGFSEEQVMQVIAQLYTEINVDGRFACVGNNLWGLKRWYPIDNKADDMASAKRPRIINDDDDDLDEEEYMEEEEDSYVSDDDDFDAFDEDREEMLGDEDEDLFSPGEMDEELEEDADIEEVDEELNEELEEPDFAEDDFEEDVEEEDEDVK